MIGRVNLAGQRLGNYRLIRLLGSGTFADVYLAEHHYLNTHVALKVLHTLPDGHGSEAFLTEARHLSQLVHPHIIRVFDFGLEDPTPYLVMDYAPHGNLCQLHPQGARLPLATVVAYVLAIASALQYAHDQHLIHRDLKPENLLLGAKHEVLLSDFGLALLTSPGEGLQVQERLGTLAYMAPEQIRGQPSAASDQYALATLVYEWLCGQQPFQGTVAELTSQHLYSTPAALRERHPDLPPAVEQVVLQALSKDPARRFVDVLSFASALEEASQALAHLPLPSTPLPVPAAASSSLEGSPISFQNIPVPLTPLVGRAEEVQAIAALVLRPGVRLLTLTGPPGVGKTRLAVQVGSELQEKLNQDVCFVGLAAISDPAQVIPTIAYALGLHESGERLPGERLKAFLHDKQFVLLLDNFEQVLSAATQLTGLLSACPQLKLLVTSRAVLRVEGEYEFAVPPLALPDREHLPPQEALAQVASVALFVQRAQAVKPQFQLSEDNARTVVEICRRLEGLPLALELAAARTRLFPLPTLLIRLEHRLSVLTGARQDVHARQRTLRDTIAWSYDLLNREEQAFLRRLCVFAGSCTLEAVEAVCRAPGDLSAPALDLVASLLDHSLLQQHERGTQEPGLQLFEMIRDFGLELLEVHGELERCQHAHATYYLQLSEQARAALPGAQQLVWLEQLEQEHGNIRAALDWLLAHHETESALRIASALRLYWFLSGRLSEGRGFLEQALAAGSRDERLGGNRTYARALDAAGYLAFVKHDPQQAAVHLEASLELFERLQDQQGIATSLSRLGTTMHVLGKGTEGLARMQEALTRFREMGETSSCADVLFALGSTALLRGEYDQAREQLEESQALCPAGAVTWVRASGLHYLGFVSYAQADYARARLLSEESLAFFRRLRVPLYTSEAMVILSCELLALGEETNAQALLEEALTLARERENIQDLARVHWGRGHLALRQNHLAEAQTWLEESITEVEGKWLIPRIKWVVASCLEGLGEIALARDKAKRAVQLFAAAQTVRGANGYYTPVGMEQPFYERTLAMARTQLGEEDFSALWKKGLGMTVNQALAMREIEEGAGRDLPVVSSLAPSTAPALAPPAGLTRHEVEVLRLVAQGLTSHQIAEQLVLSPNTVNVHVQSIYNKLGVSTRVEAARFAIEHHLL